jgi:hypothetical protein
MNTLLNNRNHIYEEYNLYAFDRIILIKIMIF